MTISKPEYWFLDSCVELRQKFDILLSSNLDEYLNRPGHGLDRNAVVQVLGLLFLRGDLEALRIDKSCPTAEREVVFVPSQSDIESLVRRDADGYYGLTAQGGSRWEEISDPNWDLYVSDSYWIDPNEAEIISRNRDMAERMMLWSYYFAGDQAVPNSIRWDYLSIWEATYWKTLTDGHRVRYSYTHVEPDQREAPPLEIREFDRRWYRRFGE